MMTEGQIASLRIVGDALKHIGGGFAESFNHAGQGGAKPLRPLDVALERELRNLSSAGLEVIAEALVAFRSGLEGASE